MPPWGPDLGNKKLFYSIDAAPCSTKNIHNTEGFSHAFFICENHFVLEGKGF